MKPIYKWIAAASGMLFLGFLVWYFHTIVFYILTAAVVALMGKPIMRLCRRVSIKGHKIPVWVCSMLTLTLLFGFFIVLLWALMPIFLDKLRFLSSFNLEHVDQMLREPIHNLETAINSALPSVHFSVREVVLGQLEPFLASGVIKNILNSLTSMIVDFSMAIFAVLFISFFFLKEEKLFGEGVVMLFPGKYEENIQRAMSSITNLLVRYFIGICIESLIKFICIAIPLYFLGFDWGTAVMIGLISGVLNVIPYIGSIISAFFSILIVSISPVEGVALTTSLLHLGIVMGAAQLIDNIILQPYIYSSSVKAHPLEIFIVILMAGYMAGVMGMLLAIPAYTVLRVIAKEFLQNMRVVQRLTDHI